MSATNRTSMLQLAIAIPWLLAGTEQRTLADERSSRILWCADADEDKAELKWGNLSGQVLYDGIWPQPRIIQATGRPILDESLVVDPQTSGIANVVIWVYLARDQQPISVHPSHAETPQQPAVMNIAQDRYQPHILFARSGQPIRFQSHVQYVTDVNIATLKNRPSNPLLPSGGAAEVTLQSGETLPVAISGGIHPWLKAYLVVMSHPYVAISGKNGRFLIRNLPVGTHTFQVWHEAAGYVTEANANNEPVKWERGRFTFDIKPGENSLGQVKLTAGLFKP